MKKHFYLVFGAFGLLLSVIFVSCSSNTASNPDSQFVEIPLRYARLFKVFKSNDVTRIDLVNPWDTTTMMTRYYLVSAGAKKSFEPKDGIVVEVPLKSMACAFATEVSSAEELGLLDAIVGVSEKRYINNAYVRSRLDSGLVTDIGPSMSVDLEKLIKISPDIFFVSPFKDNKYGPIEASGIPLGMISGYLETHPLGRAEWLKFMALFFGKEKVADSSFTQMEQRYNALAEKARSASYKPTVISSKPYQGIWYVSPGNSYMAQLFADAGANYIYADKRSQGPLPFDFETVYKDAVHADYWVVLENYPGHYTYKTMLEEYAPFGYFDAFKNRKVVFCNTYNSTYYDEGILKPDVLLSDLLKAFHPDLMADYVPVYFSMLESAKP